MAGKIILNKFGTGELIGDVETIGEDEILKIYLKKMLIEGNYNEGENYLFKAIEANKTKGAFDIGMKFYETLMSKTDEELEQAGFSREEVKQGIEELKLLFDDF